MRENYDVIVIGAGSAGCIVARRLSDDATCRVLLVEAGVDLGPMETPDIRHPSPLSAYDAGLQWPGLRGQIVGGAEPRAARVPQGRVVGGSSSINAMVALRGVAADYDEWAASGAQGWSWREVEPQFRRLEAADASLHCDDAGAIAVSRQAPSPQRPLSNALMQAWADDGFALVTDPNADFSDGRFVQPVSTDAGGRCSANRAYLGARTRLRDNLTLLPGTTCRRLLVQGGRVEGVELDSGGAVRQVRAGHVFLCAGALQTPAILLRSGIGEAAALEQLGLQVNADVPGVGRNMQNHCAVPLGVAMRAGPGLPLHLPTAHAALRFSSDRNPSRGDVYLTVWDRAAWHTAGAQIGVLNVVLHRPHSTGTVRLRSADPRVAPAVDFNMLDTPSDVERLSMAVRRAVGFLRSPHVRAISDGIGLVQMGRAAAWMGLRTPGTLAADGALGIADRLAPQLLRALHPLALKPLPRNIDDADGMAQQAMLRASIVLQYHQVGTCAMGPAGAAMAVTSPRGQVHGVQGLSVADASVLPAVPRANTNLPVMMAAEKICAMFLRTDERVRNQTEFTS